MGRTRWGLKDATFEKIGTSHEGVCGATDFDGVGAGVKDSAEAEGFGLVVLAGEAAKVIGLAGSPDGKATLELRVGEERGEIGRGKIEVGGDGAIIALVQAPGVEEVGGGWEGGGHGKGVYEGA
ncbi:MAG: hypothetical protein AABZ53_02675 [Planctomycetota bacterium]